MNFFVFLKKVVLGIATHYALLSLSLLLTPPGSPPLSPTQPSLCRTLEPKQTPPHAL